MPEERKPISFRLDPDIVRLLDALKAKMHLNATAVIVTALRELAKKEGVE
jgi:predicted transcriptional regulator